MVAITYRGRLLSQRVLRERLPECLFVTQFYWLSTSYTMLLFALASVIFDHFLLSASLKWFISEIFDIVVFIIICLLLYVAHMCIQIGWCVFAYSRPIFICFVVTRWTYPYVGTTAEYPTWFYFFIFGFLHWNFFRIEAQYVINTKVILNVVGSIRADLGQELFCLKLLVFRWTLTNIQRYTNNHLLATKLISCTKNIPSNPGKYY